MLSKLVLRAKKNWPAKVFGGLLVFALVSRVYNLGYPSGYYFDEVYHAMTAKLVARNDPRAYEWTHGDTIEPATYVEWLHPPMAKYAQAATLLIAGENALGWRLSSAIFGVGVIAMTAALAQRLFKKPWVSVLAAGLAALDGLLLTQSRIAMNDIHVVFGFLVSLYAYVWYRQSPRYWRLLLVGMAIGVTIATKWSGMFVWASIGLFELGALGVALCSYQRVTRRNWSRWFLTASKQVLIRFLLLILLPLFVYVFSYAQMFSHHKDIPYFIELHRQIFYYQFHLDATHPYQSRPLQWVIDARPVWYFVEYFPNNTRADIYNTGNPFIFFGGAVAALATIAMLFNKGYVWLKSGRVKVSLHNAGFRHHGSLMLSSMKAPPKTYFSLAFILVTYLMCWVPWLFSPRIMFFYHYAPAIPLLTILTAYWWWYGWERGGRNTKLLLALYLLLSVVFFCLWYPHWVGIPVQSSIKESLYFAFEGWR